ncbi:hypothetical protein ILUMI_22941 [Ignelater luminosus]|uniref:Uncharacterized protein n=1 Tax=Ignelater luminosus TaxID=2038154 RepID=A0A8K0CCX9_IGNLU|nr:hypothetical protein ILUMI_22941 [Ignelater luminosus]
MQASNWDGMTTGSKSQEDFGRFLIVDLSYGLIQFKTSRIISEPLTLNPFFVEYYWREYNGIIPSDAIPGGFDSAGNPTYIGQIPYRGPRLLPATINKDCNTAYSTVYGREVTADTHVKILCSKNQDRYSWIPTRYEDLHLLTTCQLVVGGMEKENTLYIGRIYHDRKTRIGKVYDSHTSREGLLVPYKGKEIEFMSFEVLAYNCTLNPLCGVINVEST